MAKVTPLSATQVKQALTNIKVKAAIDNGKVFKMRDGEGLHLRIRPNGSRTWVLEYVQPYTKKRTSLSFGTYPEISLAQAREEKTKVRELLSQSIDPKAAPHNRKSCLRVALLLSGLISSYSHD